MSSVGIAYVVRGTCTTYCRLLNTVQYFKYLTPKITGAARFHTCITNSQDKRDKRYAEIFQKERSKTSVVLQDNVFEDAYKKKPNRKNFEKAIETFEGRDIRRRGHVQFIHIALKWMKRFGLEKDVKAYNRILHIFPKGEFIPENFIQTMFHHYPDQQTCAIKVLQQMEDNGVMPDEETKGVLLAVFGRKGHPVRKLQRMLYWFYKFRHVNPFPVPKELPEDPVEVAELGLKRISDYDAHFHVFKYTNDSGRENFIAQVMSPEQKELLAEHPTYAPVYIEGGYNLWLRNKKVSYFVLRADNITLVPSEKRQTFDKQDGVAVHKEGPVFAICMTGDDSRESLRMWISNLQEDNPNLGNIPVMFNIHQSSDTKEISAQVAS